MPKPYNDIRQTVLRTVTVSELSDEVRFSEFAEKHFPELPSRKSVKKAIKKALFLIDGSVAHSGDWVRNGMVVQLIAEDIAVKKIFELPMEVVFEDEYLAVIVKPAGVPVSGNYFKTVQNALPSVLSKSAEVDAFVVPRPVHRLDSQTSGLLVVAKTISSAKVLGSCFEARCVQKGYYAILCGTAPHSLEMRSEIEDRLAHSSLVLVKTVCSLRYGTISLVRLEPHTGRTHQLRIHCLREGLPIYGDPLYGDPENSVTGKGLFLAACELTFPHPVTHASLHFHIPVPHKFASLLERESRRYSKFNG